jgi:hypothetical protein
MVNFSEHENGFKASCSSAHLTKSGELFYIVISEMFGRSIIHQSVLGERRGFFFFRARMNHISLCRFLKTTRYGCRRKTFCSITKSESA